MPETIPMSSQHQPGGRPGRGGEPHEGAPTTIWSMARREVLVHLDDSLVAQLDRLAEASGTNRSELLRRGARAVIAAEETAGADRELADAYRRLPPDPAVVRSAARLATRTAPEW